jgi:hypothetical protein
MLHMVICPQKGKVAFLIKDKHTKKNVSSLNIEHKKIVFVGSVHTLFQKTYVHTQLKLVTIYLCCICTYMYQRLLFTRCSKYRSFLHNY